MRSPDCETPAIAIANKITTSLGSSPEPMLLATECFSQFGDRPGSSHLPGSPTAAAAAGRHAPLISAVLCIDGGGSAES